MKKVVNKRTKICCLCRHWNGAKGAGSIIAKTGGFFEVDYNEVGACFETGLEKPAWAHCSNFELRY